MSDTTSPPLVTVFYSAYSGNCKALLQFIKNLKLSLTIKYINVDNSTIRQIVAKKISVVPAIVVISGDEISLYTGTNAFEWFNVYMSVDDDNSNTEACSGTRDHYDHHQVQENPEPKPKTILEIAAELSKDRENL